MLKMFSYSNRFSFSVVEGMQNDHSSVGPAESLNVLFNGSLKSRRVALMFKVVIAHFLHRSVKRDWVVKISIVSILNILNLAWLKPAPIFSPHASVPVCSIDIGFNYYNNITLELYLWLTVLPCNTSELIVTYQFQFVLLRHELSTQIWPALYRR